MRKRKVAAAARGVMQVPRFADEAEEAQWWEKQQSRMARAMEAALSAGITPDRIAVDPGFGFAKSAEQNLELADGLAALGVLGRPVLVGPSRKRFLGSVTGRETPDRDTATAAVCVMAYERGARLFRVHNVAATRDALAVAYAVRHGP